LSQNKAKFWKKLIITLVFEKNANFFAKNCQKLQKIVIITSVPGNNPTTSEFTTTYNVSVLVGYLERFLKVEENNFVSKRTRLLMVLFNCLS
jgi:hypothetical protein